MKAIVLLPLVALALTPMLIKAGGSSEKLNCKGGRCIPLFQSLSPESKPLKVNPTKSKKVSPQTDQNLALAFMR